MLIIRKLALVFGLILSGLSLSQAAEDLKPWPAAEEGYERYVFRVPKVENEGERRVEIIVGKTLKLDPHNRYTMTGELKKEPLKGWGYSFYKLTSDGQVAGTRVAVPPGTEKVDRFISVGGEGTLARYNSKLPVVVYVPKGFEVKFRIWEAGEAKAAMVE